MVKDVVSQWSRSGTQAPPLPPLTRTRRGMREDGGEQKERLQRSQAPSGETLHPRHSLGGFSPSLPPWKGSRIVSPVRSDATANRPATCCENWDSMDSSVPDVRCSAPAYPPSMWIGQLTWRSCTSAAPFIAPATPGHGLAVRPSTAPPRAPVMAPSAPVTAPSAPVMAPSAPVTAPSAPVTAPSTPVTGPRAPVTAPSAPVTAPSAPVTSPSAPVMAPSAAVVPFRTPMVPSSAPVFPPSAPVTAPSSPVAAPSALVLASSAPLIPSSVPVILSSAPVIPSSAAALQRSRPAPQRPCAAHRRSCPATPLHPPGLGFRPGSQGVLILTLIRPSRVTFRYSRNRLSLVFCVPRPLITDLSSLNVFRMYSILLLPFSTPFIVYSLS